MHNFTFKFAKVSNYEQDDTQNPIPSSINLGSDHLIYACPLRNKQSSTLICPHRHTNKCVFETYFSGVGTLGPNSTAMSKDVMAIDRESARTRAFRHSFSSNAEVTQRYLPPPSSETNLNEIT
jgi:hypothetical protein